MRYFILSITIVLLITACTNRPDKVISKSRMEQILYDYHIAQGIINNLSYEEKYKAEMYINAVYEKNGITEEEYDSSMAWYNRHATELMDIYENLQNRFNEANEKIQLQTGNNEMLAIYSNFGDTANIWNGKQVIILRNKNLINKESFTIKADTSIYKGDKFILRSNAILINNDKHSKEFRLTCCLAIRYKDGKVISNVQSINKSEYRQISLNTDKTKEIDKIFGYYYYDGKNNERNFAIVKDIQLIKMHNKELILEAKKDTTLLNTDSLNRDTIITDTLTISKTDSIKTGKSNSISSSIKELEEKELKDSKQINIKNRPEVLRRNREPGMRRKRVNNQQI